MKDSAMLAAMKPDRTPSVEPLETRIAPAAILFTSSASGGAVDPTKVNLSLDSKSATFTDVDGDLVTVKRSTGGFQQTDFHLVAQGLGAQLQSLDFLADPTLAPATLTFTAHPQDVNGDGKADGDGFVNVGRIDATGVDLAAVTIPGDLGKVLAGDATLTSPGIGALTVQSMGRFDTTTQGGGDLKSEVHGPIKTFTVKSDVLGIDFLAQDGVGTLNIRGSVVDGFIHGSTFGKITLGGSLIGESGVSDGGRIFATGDIAGPVTIGGSILGGAGARSGSLESGGSLGAVTVKHDVIGGSASNAGLILGDNSIASVKIGGSLIGGTSTFTGAIVTHGGKIGPVTIAGSVSAQSTGSSGILAGGLVGVVKIGGDVFGTAANPVRVSGAGSIAGITIGGSVSFAEILVGIDESGTSRYSDGVLGPVLVKGDWIASSIANGIDRGGDGKYGTTDDSVIIGGLIALSEIKGITILGEARGTDIGSDMFAFESERIDSVKFGRGKMTLTAGFDQQYIGPTFDLLARELDAANPSAPDGPPTFDPATMPNIATGGKTVTYTDVDGDLVTLKTDKGVFKPGNLTMVSGPHGGLILQSLNLAGDADWMNKKASITFIVKPVDGDGDGYVDVGAIDTSGPDINKLTLPGDIGLIKGDRYASISVHSVGGRGLATQAAGGSLHSDIGATGSLTVATDLHMATVAIDGDLKSAKIGSIVGGATDAIGELVVDGKLTKLTLLRDIRGGSTTDTGRVLVTNTLSTVKIGGSILGGGDEDAGTVEGVLGVGAVTVGGSIFGGSGENSGSIYGHGIKSVKLGGDLHGGTGTKAGAIHTGGLPTDTGTIGSVTIGGSVFAGSILSESTLGAVKIAGSVIGSDTLRARITANGIDTPTPKTAVAIKSVKIGGSAVRLDLLAGYNTSNAPQNADAQIGAVKIGGDAVETNIVAGVNGMANGFGDNDDILILGGEQATIAAKIASITIGGMALGEVQSVAIGDLYAFTAEQIGALKIGKTKIPLSKTPPPDNLPIGPTGDLRVREVPLAT